MRTQAKRGSIKQDIQSRIGSFLLFAMIMAHIGQTVIRAIGVSYTACKDEFRQIFDLTASWSELIFFYYRTCAIIVHRLNWPESKKWPLQTPEKEKSDF